MPIIGYYDLLLVNLEQDIPQGARTHLKKEAALKWLNETTGQDFGYDAAKWRKRLQDNDLLYEPAWKRRLREQNAGPQD
jgi:hypothetical protein